MISGVCRVSVTIMIVCFSAERAGELRAQSGEKLEDSSQIAMHVWNRALTYRCMFENERSHAVRGAYGVTSNPYEFLGSLITIFEKHTISHYF